MTTENRSTQLRCFATPNGGGPTLYGPRESYIGRYVHRKAPYPQDLPQQLTVRESGVGPPTRKRAELEVKRCPGPSPSTDPHFRRWPDSCSSPPEAAPISHTSRNDEALVLAASPPPSSAPPRSGASPSSPSGGELAPGSASDRHSRTTQWCSPTGSQRVWALVMRRRPTGFVLLPERPAKEEKFRKLPGDVGSRTRGRSKPTVDKTESENQHGVREPDCSLWVRSHEHYTGPRPTGAASRCRTQDSTWTMLPTTQAGKGAGHALLHPVSSMPSNLA